MGEKGQYKTRQREEMLTYLASVKGKHFTAADICSHFKKIGKPIGTTTVYRQLDRMVEEGLVNKYFIDENSSACFEFIDAENCCHQPACYHCKCEKCGRLIHMDCHEITELQEHLMQHHHFMIDPMRTVFYGICEACLSDESK